MLEIDQALEIVLRASLPRGAAEVPLASARGLVLAETIHSDVDSPPHDKSIVDGYALRAEDVLSSEQPLNLLEEVVAGNLPTRPIRQGTTTRVMTGAPIPMGADAVVMLEKTSVAADGSIRIHEQPVTPGQNIMRRGSSMHAGQGLLMPGNQLRAIELGLLAEVGKSTVKVIPAPRVAIVSTGNELVPLSEKPGPGQIRNSNECLLTALVGKYRGEAVPLGIGRDDRDHLRSVLEPGLSCDVLVISGGVSAGVLDLVPSVLNGLGVRELFHKINLKPGKPLWFGVREATANAAGCLVFGLPGNPVSAFVCFELFVRPALSRLSGLEHADWEPRSAVLGQEWTYRGGRFTLHPAAVHEDGGRLVATPLAWKGSGDLFGLSRADALIRFSGQARTFRPGEQVLVHLLD